ncbi:MAG TPA: MoxR family ATPase [Blastocatellia bacterium]|nr:MoxR family ATPase [Blastocatellia bacterium]
MINTMSCTPSEAISAINALWPLKLSVMLWGSPGVGKSVLVSELARRREAKLRDVRLSQKTASDIGGLPALDHQKKQTTFYLPDFLPREDEPGILFLDELPGADEQTRIAAYGLILERRVSSWVLGDNWRIIAAGNRPEDGAISCDLGMAMMDRMIHIVIEPTAQDWLAWAVENDVAPEVMAFIQVRPDLLIGSAEMRRADHAITPSPRSWERVSNVWKNCIGKREREILICGLVGDSTAHEFLTVADELKHLASVEKIINTPRPQLHRVIPATINGLYGMAYAMAASVNAGNLSKIMNVVNELDELRSSTHNGLPLADVQTLTGSLVLERALKLGLDCGDDPAFIRFDEKRRGDHRAIEQGS